VETQFERLGLLRCDQYQTPTIIPPLRRLVLYHLVSLIHLIRFWDMNMSNRPNHVESAKRRRIECTNICTSYCSHCKSMFSLTGLMAMNSKEGFKYYKRQECEESARNGCTLCETIVTSGTTGEWISKRNNHLMMFSTLKSKCT